MKTIKQVKEYKYTTYSWENFWFGTICFLTTYVLVKGMTAATDKYTVGIIVGGLVVDKYTVGIIVGGLVVISIIFFWKFMDSQKKYKVVGKRYIRTSAVEIPQQEVKMYNETWKEED